MYGIVNVPDHYFVVDKQIGAHKEYALSIDIFRVSGFIFVPDDVCYRLYDLVAKDIYVVVVVNRWKFLFGSTDALMNFV
jgi:hypothetical protein